MFAGTQSEDSSVMGKWLLQQLLHGAHSVDQARCTLRHLPGISGWFFEEFHSPNEILRLQQSSFRALQIDIKGEEIRFWWNATVTICEVDLEERNVPQTIIILDPRKGFCKAEVEGS